MIPRRVTVLLLLLPWCAASGASAADTIEDRMPLRNASGAVMLQAIETRLTWKEARLPEATMQALRKIAAQHPPSPARRETTLVLLSGADRGARSRAATALATELGHTIYRVDLSAVVSKYTGETEKNLARVLEAANAADAILLFDEADALFGKRAEREDSHDRYADHEAGYLLARLETFSGLVLLAHDSLEAIDPSLLERVQHTVLIPKAADG